MGPFFVLTLGADLSYIPKEAKLSAVYQRTFRAAGDRALNCVMLQFTLGWHGWGRGLHK